MSRKITLSPRFQGATGKGHGGYTAGLLAETTTGRRTVDFYVTIPLGIPLDLDDTDRGLILSNEGSDIVRTRPTDRAIRIPEPVSVEHAADAQARSPVHTYDVLPDCFSCGTLDDSMNVHAGPLDGRAEFATTWTPAAHTAVDGSVLDRYVWGAIDCPSGWVIGVADGGFRPSVTGEMWAEVFEPIVPEETYVLVAWGDPWRGRRATAGTSLFDETGRCLAAAESMWVSI